MFGHLKAEDFVNLMEGADISAKCRQHLERCSRCRATSESLSTVHTEITSLEADIPEPDWEHFRSSVRNELLSRSIQRDTRVRRWTGWAVRPTVAWALSLLMAVGITVTFVWKIENRAGQTAPSTVVESTSPEPTATGDSIEVGPERSLFDDVVSLGEEQQEQLRKMLESAESGTYKR
jgi:hypothetical protein